MHVFMATAEICLGGGAEYAGTAKLPALGTPQGQVLHPHTVIGQGQTEQPHPPEYPCLAAMGDPGACSNMSLGHGGFAQPRTMALFV